MLHHHSAFAHTLEADRRAAAARQRPPADAGELERTLRAASSGDEAAWSALTDRFGARLRRVARMHRLAAHDVEDVVQTTWLRLLEHVNRIREPTAVGAWLERTARHESLRLLKAARHEQPTDHEVLPEHPAPAAVATAGPSPAQRTVAVACAMDRLPERQRDLMQLLVAEPVASYEEISRTLGMPIGSIGPTRARSLARLRLDEALLSVVGDDVG
jgi:RNA polymerase sigma factor (sigma-70 family)